MHPNRSQNNKLFKKWNNNGNKSKKTIHFQVEKRRNVPKLSTKTYKRLRKPKEAKDPCHIHERIVANTQPKAIN